MGNIIFLFAYASAQVLAPEYIKLNKPKYTFNKDLPIYEICQEMQYNFLDEWQKIKNLSVAIKQSAAEEKPISDLVKQVSLHSARVKHLAKPEWNSEVLVMWVRWSLPRSTLFMEDEFNRAQWLAKKDGVRAITAADMRMLIQGRPYQLQKPHIEKLIYLGEPNESLKMAMTLKTNEAVGLQFTLTKEATLLEICQFMKTFEADIEVSYKGPLLQQAGIEGIFKINLKDER